MSEHRFAAMFEIRSETDIRGPLTAAFVPCPAGFFPSAQQQLVYQKAYEKAQEEVALMALRRRMYGFSLN